MNQQVPYTSPFHKARQSRFLQKFGKKAGRLSIMVMACLFFAGAAHAWEISVTQNPANQPIYVCLGNGVTVSLSAAITGTPPAATAECTVSGPTWKWTGDATGTSSSATITKNYTAAGAQTINATVEATYTYANKPGQTSACPGPDKKTKAVAIPVKVLKVEITKPKPPDIKFTFDKTADPNGKVDIAATGTSGIAAEDPNLEWDLTAITGSTLTSVPNPAKGASVTYTYKKLPAANGSFGEKILTLKLQGCETTQPIKVYFDGTTAATNHPGAGTGTDPNWFFYWKQTAANFGSPTYNGAIALGRINWVGGAWVAELGNSMNGAYTPPAGGDLGGVALDGIDSFAWACRHEACHIKNSNVWYPMGYNGAIDGDGDWIPNALEAGLGGTVAAPKDGGPFTPGVNDTDADGMRDDEDLTCATQTKWTKGNADTEDWANPGHQY